MMFGKMKNRILSKVFWKIQCFLDVFLKEFYRISIGNPKFSPAAGQISPRNIYRKIFRKFYSRSGAHAWCAEHVYKYLRPNFRFMLFGQFCREYKTLIGIRRRTMGAWSIEV